MNFNEREFNSFREDLSKVVKELEEKYGVTIKPGKITYSDAAFDIKLIVTKEGRNVEQEDFLKYCSYYGFSKDDLGKKITLDGDEYVITGMKPSRRKFPIVIQSLNSGKSMLATIDSVRKALGK